MVEISTGLLEETERLKKENAVLRQQLKEATEAVDTIKRGGIDAVVFTGEKDLKIYTQSTADKSYRVLIEKLHEGAVTLDKEGTIIYCNSYFATLVNLPLEKLTGTKFKRFITKTFQKRLEALLNQGSETDLKEEIYLYVSRGTKIPVLMTATTFLLDTIFVLSIILTDLTIQKKDQEELKLRTRQLRKKNAELVFQNEEKQKRELELMIVNKELEAFTYVASHDLQEPLRKIQTFAARILEKEHAVLSDTGKNYFNRMSNAAVRMQTLIQDLLAYSQTSVIERKIDKTDLHKIIEEVESDLSESILEKGAAVEIGAVCEASINPFQFRQIMHNLIGNALKFSKKDVAPRIKIECTIADGAQFQKQNADAALHKLSASKNYCCIRLSDNGIGFDPEYKYKIFEVFQRLHGKEEYAGTGIGLAIVKKIVQNHNGVITATSELGKGARFDIYLPVL
jgi:PAS domain S-box-containing protein